MKDFMAIGTCINGITVKLWPFVGAAVFVLLTLGYDKFIA